MFGLFKRKIRLTGGEPPELNIPINEQLNNLEQLGITLKPNVEAKDILELEFRDYEEHPYIRLLMSMGRDRDGINLNSDLYPTNDVWCFDRECILDPGDYVQKLERIADMVAPIISVTDIQDNVNIEANECWISFCANGKFYRHTLSVHDDWLSIEIFTIFSELLALHGSAKRFFFVDTGNELLVVLIKRDHFHQLNKLINVFIPSLMNENVK